MNRHTVAASIFLLGWTLFLGSCASTLEEDLTKVKVGMSKSTVVQKLNDPHQKFRHKGRDFWSYGYYPNAQSDRQWKTLIFDDGKLVSIVPGNLDSVLGSGKSDLVDEQELREYNKMIRRKRFREKQESDFENL